MLKDKKIKKRYELQRVYNELVDKTRLTDFTLIIAIKYDADIKLIREYFCLQRAMQKMSAANKRKAEHLTMSLIKIRISDLQST